MKTYTDIDGNKYKEEDLLKIKECECCFAILYDFRNSKNGVNTVDRDKLIMTNEGEKKKKN